MFEGIKILGEKTGELAKGVGERANEVLEVQKMGIKATGIKRHIAEQYQVIGKYYYEQFKDSDKIVPELAAHYEQIEALVKELAITEARIADVKAVWEEEKAAKKAEKAMKKAAKEEDFCCCCCEECPGCEEESETAE